MPSSANTLVRELESQVQGCNFQNHDQRSRTENGETRKELFTGGISFPQSGVLTLNKMYRLQWTRSSSVKVYLVGNVRCVFQAKESLFLPQKLWAFHHHSVTHGGSCCLIKLLNEVRRQWLLTWASSSKGCNYHTADSSTFPWRNCRRQSTPIAMYVVSQSLGGSPDAEIILWAVKL